jgi:hypothetical protein
MLLAFYTVGSLSTRITNPDYALMPLRLFRIQQQVNSGATDVDGLAKELSKGLLYSNIRSGSTTESEIAPSLRSKIKLWPSRNRPNGRNRTASQESLTESTPLGDIIVHREVKVDIAKLADPASQAAGGRQTSVTVVEAGDAASQTYVDELYNLCYSPSMRMRPGSAF